MHLPSENDGSAVGAKKICPGSIMHSYMLVQFLKYVLEGLAVAIAAYLISGTRKSGMKGEEILGLGITAAATFAVLDVFAPSVAVSARQGSGFALGAQQVGWPHMGEGFTAGGAELAEAFQHPSGEKERESHQEAFTGDIMEEAEEPVISESFVHHETMEPFNPNTHYEGFYTRPDEEDGTEEFTNYY